jgi:hypothetical protein
MVNLDPEAASAVKMKLNAVNEREIEYLKDVLTRLPNRPHRHYTRWVYQTVTWISQMIRP